MIIKKNKLNIAVVQAAPIMFDKEKCKEKAIRIIKECTEHGAEFIVFPELFGLAALRSGRRRSRWGCC